MTASETSDNTTYHRDNYSVSTDKSRLDLDLIHDFLSHSYWSPNVPRSVVERGIQHSICFGVYDGTAQVGFARVITDQASFAYLADVFIVESHRGRGLSKWMLECILDHPALQGLRRFLLATKDAHGLYAQFGFTPLTSPERWMQKQMITSYNPSAG